MNRRALLLALASSALLAPFAGAHPDGLSDVSAAFHAAARGDGRLLVFVVPEADDDKWRRGEALGEFLNHGDADALARLDGMAWVAASMRDLRTVVPAAPEGEPLMVLVDARKIPATATAVDASLVDSPDDRWSEEGWRRTETAIDARITAIGEAITAHLPAASAPEPALARVRERLTQRIDGSYWRLLGGCGARIEGIESNLMARCGMGHVNMRSARVLYFFPVGA